HQIEAAEKKLYDLAESGRLEGGFQAFNTALATAIIMAEAAFKRSGKTTGVSTGFADLDQVLGGLHPSDLVILAARPSMGKTALAENIARNAAKAGSAVCFYSLEMSWEQLTARTLAGEARVAADWSRRPADFNLYVDRL